MSNVTFFLQHERFVLLNVKYYSYLCSVKKEKVADEVDWKNPLRHIPFIKLTKVFVKICFLNGKFKTYILMRFICVF